MSAALAARDWRARAACRDADAELFFPVGDDLAPANILQAAQAKQVCAGCTVQANCLTFALAARVDGIWGGKTATERRAVRRNLTRGAVR
jgi:WhiB family redox-sensing transcriptional regulator